MVESYRSWCLRAKSVLEGRAIDPVALVLPVNSLRVAL
jgi:hypothetical protein